MRLAVRLAYCTVAPSRTVQQHLFTGSSLEHAIVPNHSRDASLPNGSYFEQTPYGGIKSSLSPILPSAGSELLSHHLSRCPARVILLAKSHDGLRRHFAGTGNKERGDFYLDRSFVLLHQRCLGSIEKDYIGRMYISAKDANAPFQRDVQETRETSCKVIDEELMNLIIYFMARRSTGERIISSSLMSQVNNYFFDFQSVFSIPMDVAISHPG